MQSSSALFFQRRKDIQTQVTALKRSGMSVGLVPTMGALHEGHLSLVDAATRQCDRTIVSIFVNPTQFGPSEDFDRYPRDIEADLSALADYPVDCVFVPSTDEMFPTGYSTYIDPPQVAVPLEGVHRPNHFRGVATIVMKLFQCVPADVAFFGQKDYQQSLVIRHMVRDLDVSIEIRTCPTVRDTDGLALSSRNRFLGPVERKQSLAIPRSLELAEHLVAGGETDADRILQRIRDDFEGVGITRVDYAAIVDPETLDAVRKINGRVLVAIAAHVGSTRLIDNRIID